MKKAHPSSTYRFQFHKAFTFRDAMQVVPYLAELGIDAVYASPIFKADPGSNHGYDVVDPQVINPEVGTLKEFYQLVEMLREHHIGWIQDIVPNHMAFSTHNTWLMNLLELGSLSPYSSHFDSAFASDYFTGPIMVPVLGAPLEEVLKKGELKIVLKRGRLFVSYYENDYPLNHTAYLILAKPGEEVPSLLKEMRILPIGPEQIIGKEDFMDEWNQMILENRKASENPEYDEFFKHKLAELNKPSILRKILKKQYFELCYWKDSNTRMNYRRFFTVNSLICVNADRKEVFEAVHQLPKKWLDDGLIQGVRVDHIDGLLDPGAYVKRLREYLGSEAYIIVEKILEKGEELPADWPVEGSSGYDYLGQSNKLFTYSGGEKKIQAAYSKRTGDDRSADEQVAEKKQQILDESMQGELDNLVRFLQTSRLIPAKSTKAEREELKKAIAAFWTHFPVYRFYGNAFPLPKPEYDALKEFFVSLHAKYPQLSNGLQRLENILFKERKQNAEETIRAVKFYQRLMQFSGPLMAKGVEDTLMYTYNRFVAHNEVGDHPGFFSLDPQEFHHWLQKRSRHWPQAMNASSTHDTKRSEDVRARLQVLSELSGEWEDLLKGLQPFCPVDIPWSDAFLVIQTLLGVYPGDVDDADLEELKDRLKSYLEKALREGKASSNWTEPDTDYEQRTFGFALKLMEGEAWEKIQPLLRKLDYYGKFNSLAQLTLKHTAPGIPDTYQGTDLWDLSLVDPDNRRPVNYGERSAAVENWTEDENIAVLWNTRSDGRVKLHLLQKLLNFRQGQSALFREGLYRPLKVKGRYREHLLAFVRQNDQHFSITVIPLYIAKICEEQKCGIHEIRWKDTRIELPEDLVDFHFRDLLSARDISAGETLPVKELFREFPLAVLYAGLADRKRGGGILLPVASLPGPFGVGDIGPSAYKFIDYLASLKQTHWQLLPLNPSGANEHYSPYSATSAMAGNPIYISPELLASQGLLGKEDLLEEAIGSGKVVDYPAGESAKNRLLDKAYENFHSLSDTDERKTAFEAFIETEKIWLDDFALYTVLKIKHAEAPWYEWESAYRNRNVKVMQRLRQEEAFLLRKVMWKQFVFFHQWSDLRNYSRKMGVKLFGDLPFYVNHDSSDVWSKPAYFSLNNTGKVSKAAGVPPDYFNADGQLWGMPTFKWDKLKEDGYGWWVERIRKNMELYDVLRLDHFRAFYDYWEVPGKSKTAKDGVWKKGPGKPLFDALEKALGKLPFIAEDLGDISEGVYVLRGQLKLPGMKVLQFAFGEDLPSSPHIPHNYRTEFVAYTGTHDNNTAVGWYRKDADEETRQRLSAYAGVKVSDKNVHGILTRLAWASVAELAIVPMQDVLALDEKSRMNVPATTGTNWKWRLQAKQMKTSEAKWLKELSGLFGR